MNAIHSFLLIFLTVIRAQDYSTEEERIKDELEMAGLELRDDCETFAQTYKSSLITNTFSEKIKAGEAHGRLLKTLSRDLEAFRNNISPELTRNWTILTKPGDGLLQEADWNALVSFKVGIDEFVHSVTVHCKNGSENCIFIKKGYDQLLQTSRNETLLRKSWSAWQTLLSTRRSRFPHVIKLVNKAALLNGYESVAEQDARSYWEMLSEQDGAYNMADDFWKRLQPLYFKLQSFVRKRLFRFYNLTSEETEIPVYLSGSNFGDDWSHVAAIVAPQPQIETFIKTRKIQDFYKLAEAATRGLSLGGLGARFWSGSRFNMSFCENHIVTDCVGEYSELLTCNEASWGSYLDAFETAIDVTLRNLNYIALPQMHLRYSVIDEAVKTLGPVLAVKNLKHQGVQLDKMTELVLIALRILPKLPYYLAADRWRLHVLEHGMDDAKWWEYRHDLQGVQGVTDTEPDYLGDAHITSNRPYLSKFLGTILTFQLISYYKDEEEDNLAASIAADENFLTMLHERSATDWPSLLGNYYSIYDLNADAIFDYFLPLEDYLDTAPLDPPPTTAPPSVIAPTRHHESAAKSLLRQENVTELAEEFVPPLPPHHEHVEENLEGPNSKMEVISMYIGIALLVAVAVLIVYVIVTKKMKKKRAGNNRNRRFET